MEGLVLIGGGGHGAVVLDAVLLGSEFRVLGVLDQDPDGVGELLGVPILGGDDLLPDLPARGVTRFIVCVGSVGDASTRRRLHEAASAAGLQPVTVKHPSAVVAGSARIGAGSYVGALAHVGPRAVVGEGAIINTHASVDHDCDIGDFAHIAPGAVLSGGVKVGPEAHVGAGAVLSHGVTVGEKALVGAGAVVVRDIEAQRVAYGNPARERREVDR